MNTQLADMIKQALSESWHQETANNSIDRWLKICEQEGWNDRPADLRLLIRIFGASWYFTRFIFVGGTDAIDVIDNKLLPEFDRQYFVDLLMSALEEIDLEPCLNRLRILKNIGMLQILVAFMNDKIDLEKMELALTQLAEAVLEILIKSFKLLPQHQEFPVTILGMGRMAGYEMTFGSDLDLIFLYEPDDQQSYTDMGKTIRLLLRTIAQPASVGILYDVDMRLRPHGNSGPLITSYNTFIEHHGGIRDIWEKQMMTRCRPVLIGSRDIETVMNQVMQNIYTNNDHDILRKEIISMRMRVQKELGSPKGKYEIKRGYGGIMDLDFISHYFQLAYGNEYKALQSCSTRNVFRVMSQLNLIDTNTRDSLLEQYNYLKRVEMYLRLFDMKSVDSFTAQEQDNIALSRAMGHGDVTGRFLEEFESVNHSVRGYFQQLLQNN